jgi:hypothetical protein
MTYICFADVCWSGAFCQFLQAEKEDQEMAERLPNPRWGAMNFAQDPTTAVGFLGFIKTAQSMVGIIGNIFELGPDFVMPQFFVGRFLTGRPYVAYSTLPRPRHFKEKFPVPTTV